MVCRVARFGPVAAASRFQLVSFNDKHKTFPDFSEGANMRSNKLWFPCAAARGITQKPQLQDRTSPNPNALPFRRGDAKGLAPQGPVLLHSFIANDVFCSSGHFLTDV
jgi:hypothetical protein